ncbi:MAG: DUF3592 domain-containing protein [Rudaea sp.]|nr:DUF3592 domain-containing protein [Rudaea sp.]
MKILWIFGAIFFVVGMGMLTGGISLWRSHSDFMAHALSAEGVVTDQAYRRSTKGGGTYSPVVEFNTPDGKIVHMTGATGSGTPSYVRGERVRVLYDGANPEHAQIDSFMESWFGILILGGMGLVFALVGGGILRSQVRQRKVRGWLAQNGMRVQANFEGVVVDTSLSVNGRNPWRLTCQWQHPLTKKVYLFRSDPVWFDPGQFVERQQLDVVVNMDDPRQYQVDSSFLPAAG